MTKTKCPYCGSNKVQRRGNYPRQRYMCSDNKHPVGLSRYFYEEKSPARVLVFDIETLPMQFIGWKLWDKITSPDFIEKDWVILSYAHKWLFEPEHKQNILTQKEALEYDDERLVKEVWKLFNEADIIIAHNGDHFDIPRMNTRFLYYGLEPPSPYKTIDTCDTAKRALSLSSYSLDYIGEYYGLGKKIHTDIELWKRCKRGEKDALEEMVTYNGRDVYLLEDVYVMLRPWIKHPNMGLYVTLGKDKTVCPRCASDDFDWGGTYRTEAGVFHAFRCNHCGAIGRATKRHGTTNGRAVV